MGKALFSLSTLTAKEEKKLLSIPNKHGKCYAISSRFCQYLLRFEKNHSNKILRENKYLVGVCRLSSTCTDSPPALSRALLQPLSFSHLLLAQVRLLHINVGGLVGWLLAVFFLRSPYFCVNFSCSLYTCLSISTLSWLFYRHVGNNDNFVIHFQSEFHSREIFYCQQMQCVRSRVSFMTCTRSYANPKHVSLALSTLSSTGWMDGRVVDVVNGKCQIIAAHFVLT